MRLEIGQFCKENKINKIHVINKEHLMIERNLERFSKSIGLENLYFCRELGFPLFQNII